jgi:aspartate kinase
VGIRTPTGVARRTFGALAEKGTNLAMISTSAIRVSVVVELAQRPAALKEAFKLG